MKFSRYTVTAVLVTLAFVELGAQTTRVVHIEGHRGARGHLPENTIPSFIRAIELGADTIELDVVISKDKKVVVSHEPWFSSIISLDPDGRPIAKEKEREHNIFLMTYAEIKKYDVGSRGNPGFPGQKPMKLPKPLLSDTFASVDKAARSNRWRLPDYNIEIKSSPEGDDQFHPAPDEFVKLVLETIGKYNMVGRVKIQSFDVRPLKALRRIAPEVKIALLVGNRDAIRDNLARLGFKPDAYSPNFSLIDAATVEYCRSNGMRLVPWTVNEVADLERMKALGIDAIITDYPERAAAVFRK